MFAAWILIILSLLNPKYLFTRSHHWFSLYPRLSLSLTPLSSRTSHVCKSRPAFFYFPDNSDVHKIKCSDKSHPLWFLYSILLLVFVLYYVFSVSFYPWYDDKLHPVPRPPIGRFEVFRSLEPPLYCCWSQVHPDPGW